MKAGLEWIPMRWPRSWRDPALLDLLRDSPVNVLLMPPDRELAEVRAQAQQQGLSCWEMSPAGEVSGPQGRFRIVARGELDWKGGGPIVAAGDCVWPAVAAGSGASAGPTGVPWVDSNGWFAQLARTLLPGREVWLFFDPPAKTVLAAESYAVAVADAEVFGARWAIALDEGLQSRPDRAGPVMRAISAALNFFQRHRNWSDWPVCAAVGVLSDFSGEHRHMAEEILNLLSRRHLPYRVLDKAAAAAVNLNDLKAIVYPDPAAPPPELEQRLLGFVRRGGLLVTGPQWRARAGSPGPPDVHGRFQVLRVGKGRLAIAREAFSDPYLVALDTHLLLGRSHDLLRLWNGGSLNVHYAMQADGTRAVVHLINYAARPAGHEVTLGMNRPVRRALFREPAASEPRALTILPAPQGVELPLPGFGAYAAVELEV